MTEFKAILVEGLFYDRNGFLHVEQDDGAHVSLLDTLTPLLGQRVQFALHHLPPHGVQQGQPGAGSCKFPQGVGCPVGHDCHPDRLLSIHTDGVLRQDPWQIERFDGTLLTVPFSGMVGHYGRIAVASIIDVEKMRDALTNLDPGMLASAGLGSKDLETILERLRTTTRL